MMDAWTDAGDTGGCRCMDRVVQGTKGAFTHGNGAELCWHQSLAAKYCV